MPIEHTKLKDLYTVVNSENQTRGKYTGSNPLEAAKKVFKKIVFEEGIKKANFKIFNMSTGKFTEFTGTTTKVNKKKYIKTKDGIIEINILHKYVVNQI